jgi:AcrR family transcriptional regulator
MSRRQRSSKAPAVRPTYTKILDHAMAVLNEDGFDRFSVQRVLDEAEVSRATLYRHFPDVDALIEAALIEAFRQEVDLYLNIVTGLIEQSSDPTMFRNELRTLIDAFSTLPAVVRLHRTHTIALAATRPQLAAAIATVQETLTDGWDTTLQDAQHRGFVRADLDTRAAAVLIQAMALGRIVDDAATNHLDNQRWAQTFFEIVDRAILAADN